MVLTARGARLCARAEVMASELEQGATSALTAHEREQLLALLQKIFLARAE
jgi:DNA-binding MarR family transcriptional regulator